MVGGGLRVRKASNVIIRNLEMGPASESDDLIDIDESTQVWVGKWLYYHRSYPESYPYARP
jgi:pectate lyase